MERPAGHLAMVLAIGACGHLGAQHVVSFPESHFKLTSGAELIVLPDFTTDLVEVDVRYRVGSRDDPPGKAGLAHLVEHLMFQQHQAGPNAPPIVAMFRELSIYYNAYTSWDSTHYKALVPSARMEDVLGLEVARLLTGCETIDADTFGREREVVRNEIRTRHGTPEAQLDYLLLEALYPAGHPYRAMIGGDDEQLAAITLDDVCAFMEKNYVPERATFLLAGNVNEAQAKAAGAKHLARLQPHAGAVRAAVPKVELRPGSEEHSFDVEETSVFAAWALPPVYSDEFEAVTEFLGQLRGRTAFFGDVYELATGWSMQILGGAEAPMLVLQVSVADAGLVEEAKATIRRAAGGLRSIKLTPTELYDARARLSGDAIFRLEELGERADIFGDFAQFRGYRFTMPDEIARAERFDPAFVSRVGREVLDPDKARFVVIVPRKGEPPRLKRATLKYSVPADADARREEFAVDRAEAARAIDLPPRLNPVAAAKSFTLDNGLHVIVVPVATRLPVVTTAIRIAAGFAHEPADRPGLAGAAARFLYSGQGFQLLAHVGAAVQISLTADSVTFYARGLSDYLDALLYGLDRWVRPGSYGTDTIERWADRRAHALQRASVAAEDALTRAYLAAIYGPGHPYTHTADPTADSVARIRHDDLLSFKRTRYTPDNATVIVVGAIDPAYAESVIRAHFRDWGSGGDKSTIPPAAAPSEATFRGVVGEHMEMVPVAIAFPIADPLKGDYPARLVVAEMLNQRMRAVREKLGASYGINARFHAEREAGAYVISGSVDPQRSGEALRVMRASLAGLRRGEGFVEDFVRARRRVLERRLAGATSTLALALRVAWLDERGVPLTFENQILERVARLTPKDAMSLIAHDLVPEHEVVVAFGKRPVLERTFADAGIDSPRIEP